MGVRFKKWRLNNPEKNMQLRENERTAHQKDPRRMMVRHAKYRAKLSGIEFSIEVDDIAPCPEVCPLLGIPLFAANGAGALTANSPTLDRIKNDLGYVPGNVMIISHLANSSKRELCADQLMRLATNLKKFEEQRSFPWE